MSMGDMCAGQNMYRPGYELDVCVSATSANLGVGFDVLGLALGLTARFSFARTDELEIVGCPAQYQGTDNLVWTSYCTGCAALGHTPSKLRIAIDSDIPTSGGLGSSSTCVVAGLVAAQLLHGLSYDPKLTLELALALEGHPDNVAPAILGGLVSTFVEDGKAYPIRRNVDTSLRFIAIAPPYQVRTEDARKVIPEHISTDTAIWQMGRCVATVEAMANGNLELLSRAAHDKLHEPFRAALIPDFERLKACAYGSDAAAFLISGSGATMLAITDVARAPKLEETLKHEAPAAWIKTLAADPHGVRFHTL